MVVAQETAPDPRVIDLVTQCEEANIPLLKGCDSITHHILWGSVATNRRDGGLAEFIASVGLQMANRGSEPTFFTAGQSSVADLTLGTRALSSNIRKWCDSLEDSLPDYRYITFEVSSASSQPERYRNPRATN